MFQSSSRKVKVLTCDRGEAKVFPCSLVPRMILSGILPFLFCQIPSPLSSVPISFSNARGSRPEPWEVKHDIGFTRRRRNNSPSIVRGSNHEASIPLAPLETILLKEFFSANAIRGQRFFGDSLSAGYVDNRPVCSYELRRFFLAENNRTNRPPFRWIRWFEIGVHYIALKNQLRLRIASRAEHG